MYAEQQEISRKKKKKKFPAGVRCYLIILPPHGPLTFFCLPRVFVMLRWVTSYKVIQKANDGPGLLFIGPATCVVLSSVATSRVPRRRRTWPSVCTWDWPFSSDWAIQWHVYDWQGEQKPSRSPPRGRRLTPERKKKTAELYTYIYRQCLVQ